MTRLWTKGLPLLVIADSQGIPQRFEWRSQVHHIAHIHNTWRIDTNWWRRRVWRTCFKLSTDSNLLVVLYQDMLTGQWYLQRLYD